MLKEERGRRHFPSFVCPHSHSTEPHHTQHDKIPAGLSAAGSCVAQCWLSALRSISPSPSQNQPVAALHRGQPLSRGTEHAHILKKPHQTSGLQKQEPPKGNVGLKMVSCTPSVARKSHGCLATFRSINKGIKDVHRGSPSTGSLLGNIPKQMNGVTLLAKGDPEGLVVVRSTKKIN